MTPEAEPTRPRLLPLERLTSISSLIAEGAAFTGHFQAQVDLGIKIDGKLEGNVMFAQGGTIHVGVTGVVENTRLEADYIYIEGRVRGAVIARKALEITGTATLLGDASYDEVMDIHPRARVRGKLEYRGDMEDAKSATAVGKLVLSPSSYPQAN
ncbi:MAG TPA: polymer-forming cytoskeletal protein [Ramlibacter sp.]|uniref:bactofilin family protein n=1 Tax=Ramlibacter sp. TaxID=1917967 RepID=UPI002BD957C7|nr:polymer-forming cytoskeletal protein [Ramlibacter sp.]HVZ42312.1 polymer-forming cytoskeletal protein [Ramlibacter sp.]